MEKDFVGKGSIVRKIWGTSDTVLLIFAGSAAEFALNRSVDWLYFTGKLPADPIGRLFSTVRYAREIVFSSYDAAVAAIDEITAIHRKVEGSRGMKIPNNAYLDVLFMLIDYTIRSFEFIERRLTAPEKDEIYEVFYRLGLRMRLEQLPPDYRQWEKMRQEYIMQDLVCSQLTRDLYQRYRIALGDF
ncbi:MAG TPA: oxygenase MpaB family protein, partial [Puia sp.]|nr:oxygenase MpaB family protein [Puia sp.]